MLEFGAGWYWLIVFKHYVSFTFTYVLILKMKPEGSLAQFLLSGSVNTAENSYSEF